MKPFKITPRLKNPAVGFNVAKTFKQQLKRGMVPTKTLKVGTPIDRTIDKHLALRLLKEHRHQKTPVAQLLTCSPKGNISDANRFSGINLDSSPGSYGYYGGLVNKNIGASPGMIAELRHYGKEQIAQAPIIEEGQFLPSPLIGKPNPSYAFLDKIVLRARLNREILIIDFDRSNPQVQSFDRSFSQLIPRELDALHQTSFLDALMLDDNFSLSRPVGNDILRTDGLYGLLAPSARSHYIEPGLWKGEELNVVLSAEPYIPLPYLTVSNLIFFEERDGRPRFSTKKADEAGIFLLDELDKSMPE